MHVAVSLDLRGSFITIDSCSLLVSRRSFVAGVSCVDALHVYFIIWKCEACRVGLCINCG